MTPFEKFDKKNLYFIKQQDYDLVLAGYPEWRAFVCAADSDVWIEIIPEIDIINKQIILPDKKQNQIQNDLFSDSTEKNEDINNTEMIRKFFLTIPTEITSLASCFSNSHWELVKAIKLLGNDFAGLIKTNPALAYVIVNLEKLNPSFVFYNNIQLFQRMIKTKRKEILRLSGFTDSDQMVKIFSKIDPLTIEISSLISLKETLSSNIKVSKRILQLLSFAKKINKNLLNLCSDYLDILMIISDRIVFELVTDENMNLKVSMIRQMIKNSKKWKVNFPEIKTLKNLFEIKKKFDQKIKIKREKLDILPPPPIKGNEFIQPLTTNTQLKSWSKRQQNCVHSYTSKIKAGKCYIYKVIYENEEATLELENHRNKFELGAVLGFRNSKVSERLYAFVMDWFNKAK